MSRMKLLPLVFVVLAFAVIALPSGAAEKAGPAPAAAVQAPACGVDALSLFPEAGVSTAPKACGTRPAADLGVPEPTFLARLGYCHCGCSTARCRTNADCGGASCDPVISCC